VHLIGFVIRIYHDPLSSECQILHVIVNLFFVALHSIMLFEAGSFVTEAYVWKFMNLWLWQNKVNRISQFAVNRAQYKITLSVVVELLQDVKASVISVFWLLQIGLWRCLMESSNGTDQEDQYKPDVKVNNSFLTSFVIVYSLAVEQPDRLRWQHCYCGIFPERLWNYRQVREKGQLCKFAVKLRCGCDFTVH
jgi:hypothetical protein